MTSTPDFLELAASHGIEVDSTQAMLRTDAANADWFGMIAKDKSGQYWALRAPRRGDVLKAARYEEQVLSFVRPRIGVAVPDWKVHTDKLVAYPMLAGLQAAESDPLMGDMIWRVQPDNPVFLDSLAATMVRLHAIGAKEASAAGLVAMDAGQARQRIRTQMDDTKVLSAVPDVLWKLWERWLYDDSFWPATTGLTHGDLYHPHMLVDPEFRLVGLEDWADAEVGDVAADFAPMFSTLGREAMEDLILRYARAGGAAWPRMADQAEMYYWASPLKYAAYAMRTGDLSHLMGVKGVLSRFAGMLEESGL